MLGLQWKKGHMDEGGTPQVAQQLFKEMITAPPGTYTAKDIEQMGARGLRLGDPFKFPQSQHDKNLIRLRARSVRLAMLPLLNSTPRLALDPKTKQVPPASDGKSYTPSGLRQRAIFDRLVRDRYYEKWTNRDFEDWDPDQAYIDSAKEVVAEQKQNAGPAQAVTPKSQYLQYAGNAFSQLDLAAASNGGRVTGETIPKEAIDPGVYGAWAEQNPGKSFDSLSGLQKESCLSEAFKRLRRYDPATGQYVA